MKEAFKKLEEARQKEILNAALHEFATYGYEDASTNNIVKRAEMSKGMLYYYFNNKKSLFKVCMEYAVGRSRSEFLDRNFPYQGFIERSRLISKLKREYNQRNPEIAQFITNVHVHNDMPDDYQPVLDELIDLSYKQAYSNIDKSRFRDEIDHQTQMELITMTIQGYAQQVEMDVRINGIDWNNVEKYWDDFEFYLDALKKIYYKEEYQ